MAVESQVPASVKLASRMRTFLFVFGPAWIVMLADVDAPSVITAGESGAQFGYHLIFILLVLIVPLFFIQEVSGRVGLATGRGLAGIIREHYSKRTAVLASFPMFVTDFLTYVAEYTGIAVGLGVLGISPFISLPVAFMFHSALVFTGGYRNIERVLLAISGFLLSSYVIDSFLMKPIINGPNGLLVVGLSPFQPYLQQSFAFMVAANVGAVIMPWMLFYQAGAVAEKGLNRCHARFERFETLIGAVVSEALMIAIVIVSAPLNGVDFLSPASLAAMLTPIAGRYAPVLFGIGLASAGLLALVVVSLASTWGIAEALGWRAKIGEKFSLARNFYVVYLLETFPAALIPLFFKNLVQLMLSLMVIFVFVLAAPAILQGLIASNPKLMGPHVMSGIWKATYWLMLALVVASAVYALPTLLT